MAHIRIIDEDEAEGKLKEIYEDVKESRGAIADILKVHSLLPETLPGHLDLYMATLYGNVKGGLSRRDRELLAVVVSMANACDYCIAHHADALATYDHDLAEAILDEGWGVALEEERDQVLAQYAELLTLEPDADHEEAVGALREQGLNDEAILQAILTVSYFNFVNRVALATGLDPTADREQAYTY